jgi:hypothetical protein
MAKTSMLLCVGNDEGSLLPAPYLDTWGEEVRFCTRALKRVLAELLQL